MARMVRILALLAFAPLALAQDSVAVTRLETELRQLQREVFLLSQRVSQLGAQPAGVSAPPLRAPEAVAAPTPAASLPRWVSAVRWQALRPGMNALQVMAELGQPSSMRGDGTTRVLLYALEIGPGGFLAGSVTLQADAVTAIETPVLK